MSETVDPELEARCADLLSGADTPEGAVRALESVRSLLDFHPADLTVRLTHARIVERTRARADERNVWEQMYRDFPDCFEALRMWLRWLGRDREQERALAVIREHLKRPECALSPCDRIQLHVEARDLDGAARLYQDHLTAEPDDRRARLDFFRLLLRLERPLEAQALMADVDLETLSEVDADAVRDNRRLVSLAGDLLEGIAGQSGRLQGVLFDEVIRYYGRQRRSRGPVVALGRVALITGTLGPGGAERQMTRFACGLQRHIDQNKPIGAIKVQAVDAVIRTLNDQPNDSFYRPPLDRSGVRVLEIDSMPVTPLSELVDGNERIGVLLAHLAPAVRDCIERLVAYFRKEEVDVAFIWQDGAFYFACIAALMAGVRRIVFTVRGYPTVMRPHLHRPEYDEMFRALAALPDVTWIANSDVIRRTYIEWVPDMGKDFHVVRNGVADLGEKATPAEEKVWAEFDATTADAEWTIGGVQRFVMEKQPLKWIRFAHACLERNPRTRFVLVGTGPLRRDAMVLAEERGIADRILFHEKSNHVGFWLRRMDLLALLSKFEGLPNVLIEAQTCGIPVLATPAGGAVETFEPGRTGHLLPSVNPRNWNEACEQAYRLMAIYRQEPDLTRVTQARAAERFSIDGMLMNMVSVLAGHDPAPTAKTQTHGDPATPPSGRRRPRAKPTVVAG